MGGIGLALLGGIVPEASPRANGHSGRVGDRTTVISRPHLPILS